MFEPNQPKHYQYPKSKYKETDPYHLAFQLDWYRLHYSVEKDTAFFFYCWEYLKTCDLSERDESAFTVTWSGKSHLRVKQDFQSISHLDYKKKQKDPVPCKSIFYPI